MGITYNGTKIKKAMYNGAKLKQIMLNGVKLLSSEPFNEALALVGYSDFATLDDVLSNTAVCNALAGNAEAYGIMKANYSGEMTSAIDSNFNAGLSLLNYKCGLKCAIYKNGTFMTGANFVLGQHWGTDQWGGHMRVTTGSDSRGTYRLISTGTVSDRGANGWMQTSTKFDLSAYSKISSSIWQEGKSENNVLAFGYGNTLGVGANQDIWNTYSGTDVSRNLTNSSGKLETITLNCSSTYSEKTIGYFCSTATSSVGKIYVYDLWLIP